MNYHDVMQVYKTPISIKYIPRIFSFVITTFVLIGLSPNAIAFESEPVIWVQVPQWTDDWAVCAVDIPDAKCHWYVMAPDNTFGEGFDWENAPWFDANGLGDVAPMQAKTVVEKLQNKGTYEQVVNN